MDELRIGLIGGSGLGETLLEATDPADREVRAMVTPFGAPSAALVLGRIDDVRIAFLPRHGDGHVLPPHRVPYRANIWALKAAGCTHVVASGATGSLREHLHPGDLVVCDQVIDRTDGRPRSFFDAAAVHVEFADPFCPVLRDWLLAAARRLPEQTVHDRGTYLCMEGPSFSTRAESEMHRAWGADLVGMTALPEARLAREAELPYALLALPTDYDCWRPREPGATTASLLEEIVGNLRRATDASIALLRAALSDPAILRERRSPAADALRLAVWTSRDRIDPEERRRLALLLDRPPGG